jgi:hypothetical protein
VGVVGRQRHQEVDEADDDDEAGDRGLGSIQWNSFGRNLLTKLQKAKLQVRKYSFL